MTAAGDPLVWRGFTQAALDRAYSPSSMVESIEPFLARYAGDSQKARAGFATSRLIERRYGPGSEETLDLFLPDREGAPLLVFIHGGYWQALNKSDASFPAPAFVDAGYAYAAVNYTLAPHATMDEIVEENRRALAWLHANRRQIGAGEGGIVIAGHSAGAHLAAMLLSTDWAARGLGVPVVKGALLLGGVFDLEPIRLSYVNEPLRMDAAAARRNSPLFMKPTQACPLVVAWGEHETDEFKRQSRELAAAWMTTSIDMTAFEQRRFNHFDSLFDWCDPGSRLFAETVRLLEA